MRRPLQLGFLVLAFSAVALVWSLRSGAAENAPASGQAQRETESSLLIEPPANSAANLAAKGQGEAAVLPPRPAARANEVLPPPRQPGRQPAVRPTNRLARQQSFLRPAEPELAEPGPAAVAPAVSDVTPPATEQVPGPVAAETMPVPGMSDVVVQPTPPIETHASGSARRMYRKSGEVQLVMVVKNPADGCLFEIPLCVPACCTGEPKVDERRGIFGRGVVEYCWECGFTATVKFRHVLGDVKVEYDG